MDELIRILRGDDALAKMLNGNHVYASPSMYMGNSIVYSYYTTTSDGAVQQIRLQVRVVAETLTLASRIEDRVRQLIITPSDTPLTDNILVCRQNGGGWLYDDARQKHHRILYFDIVLRG